MPTATRSAQCVESQTPQRRCACGTLAVEQARFCHACGKALGGGVAPASPASDERKSVTVLFADLRGSTDLLRGRDPEHAVAVLGRAVTAMRDEVNRFGGTVTRVQGDGLMALFGAPLALEDHALRACQAGLAMCDEVRRLGTHLRQISELALPEGAEFAVRVGLSSGIVVFRRVPNDLTVDWDAAGEVVVLAARMEQLAAPGEVWATEATWSLVRGRVVARPLGRLPVKGLPDRVEAFALVAVNPWRSRLQAAAERHGLCRLVGRRAELSALDEALARAQRGHGQAVALVGDAGCGKSRLVYECTSSRRAEGCLVLSAACVPFAGARTGYLPLLGMTRAIFGVTQADDAPAVRDRIRTRLQSRGEVLAATLPAFLALQGVAEGAEASEWARLEPDERRRLMVDSIVALARDEAQGRPMIVVLEDLQWVDPETEAVLATLFGSLAGSRMLLLVTHRPDYEPHWADRAGMRRLDIAPLEGRDAVRLSQVLLGGSSATAPLARFLAERTGGNPFFLEETVAALAEEGILQGRRGSYRLSAGRGLDDAHAMPPNVRAVIAARVDRLPPDDKCVLQAASVVGNEFRAAVVAAVAELPEPLVCSALDRLHQAGFIHSDAGDGGGAFRHVLVQEVAYEGILHARRREMHARVVAATERLHPDRLTEQAEALARHAAIGHVWDRAVEHAGRAADRAAARNANREAVAFYDDALDALGHLPHDDPAALRLAVDLRFAARTPLFRLGEIGRTLERLREAAGPAERLGDTARLGQLAIFLSHISWLSGKHAEAVAEGERARRIAAVRGDAALAARADFQVGLGALGMCDFGEAARLMQATAQRALAPQVADRYGLDAPLAVVALGYRARALAELGAFTEAEDAVDACSVLAADVNRPFTSIFAAIAAGHLCLAGGRCGDAVPRLTEAVALCRLADAALMKPVAKALLGAAWVGAGQAGDGVRSLRSAVADAARMGFLFLQPQRLTMLAEALLSIGRPAEASRLAARALSLAKQQGERGPAAAALLVSARVADAGGRAAEAHSLATTAAARAALLGMRPLAVKATSFAAQLQVPDGATD